MRMSFGFHLDSLIGEFAQAGSVQILLSARVVLHGIKSQDSGCDGEQRKRKLWFRFVDLVLV